jgi:hypothetical protein
MAFTRLPSDIGWVGVKKHVEEPFMGNCIVVVQFDLPKRTEEQAVKGATSTAPIYRGLAAKGLIRKDYLNGDAGTGGVYLWETRALAEAWFTEDRIVDLTKRFGVRPRLTWYDTHVTVDNQKRETRVNGKTLVEAN